jgi:prepilin-type N-terminal cleavage/methylation domain-containing protein
MLVRKLRRGLPSEGGFTLIELMAALGVILVALLALAYTATIGFSDIALARQRQGANGLANQTMEQVRALPFDTLKAGLSNADLAGGGDANIVLNGACGAPTVYCYNGETIPRGNNAGVVPLVPHRQTLTVGPTTYTVAVYVTYYNNVQTANTFRITVSVSWANPVVKGVASKVTTQSIAYSASGCLSTATHPFSAPCQPFLYASGSADDGHFDVTGTVNGLNLQTATLSQPAFNSNTQNEQIASIQGLSQASGITLTLVSQSAQDSGRQRVVTAADNDPAQPGNAYNTASATSSASALSTNGAGNSLTLTPSSGDPVSSVSTSASNSTGNTCPLVGPPQIDNFPCGWASARQSGAMSAVLALNPSTNLGTLSLASVAAMPSAGTAYTNRDQPSGTDGKVHGEVNRATGTVQLATLPTNLAGAATPPGWAGYFIQVSGFTDQVTAEAGVNTAAPSVTEAGTISFWNGAGYTSRAITAGAAANLAVASVHISDASTGKLLTVDIQASPTSDCNVWVTGCLRTGGTSTAQTMQICAPACPNNRLAATATSNSPVLGDIHYKVTYNGSVVVDVVIHVDFGTLLAQSTYQPAPSA